MLKQALKDYKKTNDYELVILMKSGDEDSYAEVFERYSRPLITHAYKFLGNKDEACDIVQDVMLSLWQKRENINHQMSLGGYLYITEKLTMWFRAKLTTDLGAGRVQQML